MLRNLGNRNSLFIEYIVCFVCVPHPTYNVVCEDSGKRVGIFSQNVLFRIFQTRIFGGNKIQNN